MDDATVRGLFDRAVVWFNSRGFHEAHEDWERLWHEAEGAQRLWLQGLIQVAAAFYHYERGATAHGFVTLLARGHAKIAPYAGDTLGLDLPGLLADLEPWRAHARAVRGGADLRAGAPEPPPTLRWLPGVEPAPWLPDE
jgi:Domain of unknown function (DUF309)